jgi:hypothetical protein
MIAPSGRADVLRLRMSHLNRDAASLELFELDESSQMLEPKTVGDTGNIETRLVHLPDEQSARERFRKSIQRVLSLAPPS